MRTTLATLLALSLLGCGDSPAPPPAEEAVAQARLRVEYYEISKK